MSGAKPGADAPTRPAPMERGGFYNERSRLQAGGGAHGLPAIARAFERMPLGDGPVTIADYGSAQGRNSLVPIGAAIAETRARLGASSPVSVVHTDQPDNDFSTLFCLLRDSEDSYLGAQNIFTSAVGRSFYEQVLPAGSVTFGWCSYAIHWLSAAPIAGAGHIWCRLTTGDTRRAFERRSADDWLIFLTHRAAELRPGGCLVVVQPSMPDDEPSTFPVLMGWAQAELDAMAADGTLREAEAARMTVLCYERYPADVRAPFANGDFCGLVLAEDFLNDLPDPFWGPYQATGDAKTLADQYVGFFQAPFRPSLLAALDPDRDTSFRKAFADRLESGLHRRVIAEPQPLMTPLAVHVSLIQKR
ncbi:hypothetical protein [Mesorhizobium sp. IMUNJ 23232]|uniref:hypothetical protein n=1 Tax=Mesorhizobium sp. IMUNJ 23232 TaxID=3376064 RepID=UPI0037BA7658